MNDYSAMLIRWEILASHWRDIRACQMMSMLCLEINDPDTPDGRHLLEFYDKSIEVLPTSQMTNRSRSLGLLSTRI